MNADVMRRTNAPALAGPCPFLLETCLRPMRQSGMGRRFAHPSFRFVPLAARWCPGPPHRSPSKTMQIGTYIVNRIMYLTFNCPTFLLVRHAHQWPKGPLELFGRLQLRKD